LPADFTTQNLDAAVRSGRGDWDGLYSDKLTSIELLPVCTENFLRETNLSVPLDLSRVTLLHSISRPQDWLTWLRTNNLDIDASKGLKFENSALAYEAALQGIGIAIGVRVLVEHNLGIGAFIAPFEKSVMLDEGYFLTWPRDSAPSVPLRKFQAWLKTQL
jgi:LysR family glycine cleavage system transcriptional activator